MTTSKRVQAAIARFREDAAIYAATGIWRTRKETAEDARLVCDSLEQAAAQREEIINEAVGELAKLYGEEWKRGNESDLLKVAIKRVKSLRALKGTPAPKESVPYCPQCGWCLEPAQGEKK